MMTRRQVWRRVLKSKMRLRLGNTYWKSGGVVDSEDNDDGVLCTNDEDDEPSLRHR